MEIRKLPPHPALTKRLRVAAYVRVSRESERLTHSFSAQVSYYNQLISSTPDWEYAGVYSDYAATGTSTTGRDEFKEMITTALGGGIDIILTKSISRFARNTVDLLKTVRELSAAGVSVRFEREQIDTATAQGEILITLLAAFAQAESESISANAKWGIRKKYADGHLHSRQPYGYHYTNGHLSIVEEEAAIVRRIFTDYLAGISPEKIATRLNNEGVCARHGGRFHASMLRRILENETYTGDAICQKQYRPRIGDKRCEANTGQLTKYLIEDSHQPIIERAVFDAVQAELHKRRNSGGLAATPGCGTGLTHKILCTTCTRHYHRRTKTKNGQSYKYWWCETATKGHGNPCKAHQLREEKIRAIICSSLGLSDWDDETIIEQIARIEATPDWLLTIHHTDGRSMTIDYRTGSEVNH